MSQSLLSITINNSRGVSATLLNYGARLVSLKIPIAGTPTEMILGYQDYREYPDLTLLYGRCLWPCLQSS